jgi:hypothetical protein
METRIDCHPCSKHIQASDIIKQWEPNMRKGCRNEVNQDKRHDVHFRETEMKLFDKNNATHKEDFFPNDRPDSMVQSSMAAEIF